MPDRIRALGRAYVGFAVAHPARFTLMNRPELRRAGEVTEVHAAGMASEGPLFAAIDDGQADGSIAAGDREALALGAWAAVHGLVRAAGRRAAPRARPARTGDSLR